MDFKKVSWNVFTLLFITACMTQACHVGHKRMFGGNERMVVHFGKCLSSFENDGFKWDAIARFTLDQSLWYEDAKEKYCKGHKSDTVECWEKQLPFLVDPTSPHMWKIKYCLQKYAGQDIMVETKLEDDESGLIGELDIDVDYPQYGAYGRAMKPNTPDTADPTHPPNLGTIASTVFPVPSIDPSSSTTTTTTASTASMGTLTATSLTATATTATSAVTSATVTEVPRADDINVVGDVEVTRSGRMKRSLPLQPLLMWWLAQQSLTRSGHPQPVSPKFSLYSNQATTEATHMHTLNNGRQTPGFSGKATPKSPHPGHGGQESNSKPEVGTMDPFDFDSYHFTPESPHGTTPPTENNHEQQQQQQHWQNFPRQNQYNIGHQYPNHHQNPPPNPQYHSNDPWGPPQYATPAGHPHGQGQHAPPGRAPTGHPQGQHAQSGRVPTSHPQGQGQHAQPGRVPTGHPHGQGQSTGNQQQQGQGQLGQPQNGVDFGTLSEADWNMLTLLQSGWVPPTTQPPPPPQPSLDEMTSQLFKALADLKLANPDMFSSNSNNNEEKPVQPQGWKPSVTAQVCDDESKRRFIRCVSNSLDLSMQRSSLLTPSLRLDDIVSVFDFFRENYSKCESVDFHDPEKGGRLSRSCSRPSTVARAGGPATCLSSIMLNLVKHGSPLRNVFVSCSS